VIYGSVCSGIEAASVAWHPLGWRAAFLSEIEAFPRAVLAHHYPDVPLHGDFTTIQAGAYDAIDLLVGGTPCQSFSVAGLRGGLDDERGNLALQFLKLAQRLRPRWVVWENVPGVLSSNGGRDFGSILGGLAELGYGWAYRVLDAQYFGLAQRRRRVFVVGCLGDWRRAAAVLFERHSLSGHPAPRREAGQAAPTIPSRSTAGGGLGTDFACDGGYQPSVAGALGTEVPGSRQPADASDNLILSHDPACTLNARDYKGPLQEADLSTVVAHALRGVGFDASEDGTGRGTPLVPVYPIQNPTMVNKEQGGVGGTDADSPMYTLEARLQHGVAIPFDTTQITSPVAFTQNSRSEVRLIGGSGDVTAPVTSEPGAQCQNYVALPLAAGAHPPAVAFQPRYVRNGRGAPDEVAAALTGEAGRTGKGDSAQCVTTGMAVRRLTPRECERLQGFPDDYTLIPYRGKPAADGPRYKALGNSMAVPVMRWIGERIQMVEDLALDEEKAA
jgi:DNA (cytosine-5)-methyltransferase 1